MRSSRYKLRSAYGAEHQSNEGKEPALLRVRYHPERLVDRTCLVRAAPQAIQYFRDISISVRKIILHLIVVLRVCVVEDWVARMSV